MCLSQLRKETWHKSHGTNYFLEKKNYCLEKKIFSYTYWHAKNYCLHIVRCVAVCVATHCLSHVTLVWFPSHIVTGDVTAKKEHGTNYVSHVNVNTHIHTHTHTYIHTYSHMNVNAHIHIHTFTHTHLSNKDRKDNHLHTHVHTHTYTHTYTHTITH